MALSTGKVVALIQAMGGADPAVIESAVQDWLDAHPEATTTVQDGSITEQKLATSIAQKLGLISSLSDEIDAIQNATTTDIGKALSPKTVTNGKVTEWQYKAVGGGSGGGAVSDVQINGTSILDGDGVADIPIAALAAGAIESNLGVVKVRNGYDGLTTISSFPGRLCLYPTNATQIKAGNDSYLAVTTARQHESTFYGLAKAAGDNTQSASSNAVGTYTESAKSAIHNMLSGSVAVSGTTPTITAMDGIRYVCGEVSTLDITLPASGIIDVVFESGSTATVLTITPPTGTTLKWANGFDPTALEANKTYEINIADGLGVACAWS